MDRQLLDRLLPGIYAILIIGFAMTTGGRIVGIVTVIGAMLLGLYYGAIRPRLVQQEVGEAPREQRRAERRERRRDR